MVRYIILFILLPLVAWGEPSISGVSGTVAQGQSITITGAGFGIKSTPAPIMWDDFENGVSGGDLSEYGSWDYTFGYHNKYSNVNNRPGSTLSMRHDLTVTKDPSFNAYECNARYNVSGSFPKVFYSYWMWFQWGECNGQIKWGIRIADFDASTHLWSEPRFDGCVYPGTGGACSNSGAYFQGNSGYLDSRTCFGSENAFTDGAWVQIEVQALQSTPSTSDGSLECWMSKPTGFVKVVNQSAIVMRSSEAEWDATGIYTWIDSDDAGDQNTICYDDIYIDNSWARVVIGDAPTYDNCTRREIQIPSAWSNTSITASVNQGAFGDSDTAYLYVVDDDGVASSGYEITLGEGSATWSVSGTMIIH